MFDQNSHFHTLQEKARTPSIWHAAICFMGVLLLISSGLFVAQVSLHVLIFFSLVWVGINARGLGYSFIAIRRMMDDGIAKALPAIYIFLLIGMVIASFMHSGTIACLMYYGLSWLTPGNFLAIGLLLCSLMSIATGTAWGTVGTIGVVLIGIGDALGIPLPLVAGMIISGATFGDKLSPISDTTNLAAMSAGAQLYRHIGSMLYTTLPTFIVVLIIFILWGMQYGGNSLMDNRTEEIRIALASAYQLEPWWTLLPLLLMFVMSVKRYSAEISMSCSILLAISIAVIFQGKNGIEMINALWLNTPGTTGIESIDDMLGRGGLYSMAWTLVLSIMALALGGVLHHAGFLKALLRHLIVRIQRVSTLIAATIISGLVGNMALGEAYISILLNGQLFKDVFQEKLLDNAILSRSIEEGSTLTTALIPWTTAGTFYAVTLGVSTLDYAEYALLNLLNPLISVVMAMLGIGIWRIQNNRYHA